MIGRGSAARSAGTAVAASRARLKCAKSPTLCTRCVWSGFSGRFLSKRPWLVVNTTSAARQSPASRSTSQLASPPYSGNSLYSSTQS
jgi:hypothetical protein